PDKIKTIHLGISEWVKKVRPRKKVLQKYLPDKVIERGYIFYESGVNPSKNITGLIKSYRELLDIYTKNDRDDYPYLVFAGKSFTEKSDPYLNEISNLIETLSLQDKVYFTGYFEDEDLDDLICGGTLGINLSFYEGFGFGPLQVMKAGLPLIASNTSCYPEALGDGAKLVDPGDPKKVAKEAYSLLTHKKSLRSLAQKGIEQARQYTWENTAKETYNYFVDIVSKFEEKR
ncbi:MAG: glycosyltransferase, partial [bacterium]